MSFIMGMMIVMLIIDGVSIVAETKDGSKKVKNYICHILAEVVALAIGVYWYTH